MLRDQAVLPMDFEVFFSHYNKLSTPHLQYYSPIVAHRTVQMHSTLATENVISLMNQCIIFNFNSSSIKLCFTEGEPR